jgi:hypothetical protein
MTYDILTIYNYLHALYAAGVDGVRTAMRQRTMADGTVITEPDLSLWIEQYSYPLRFDAFASATGNAVQNLTINANADFLLTRIRYAAYFATPSALTVSTKPIAQVRALITDAGSARPFFAGAMTLENFAEVGGQVPKPLSFARWLAANTAINVQLVGYGPAETFNIELAFEGLSCRRVSPGM